MPRGRIAGQQSGKKYLEVTAGKTYGSWLVKGEQFWVTLAPGKRYHAVPVVCQCGTETSVPVYGLLSGKTLSCGCAQREAAAALPVSRFGVSVGDRFGFWTVTREPTMEAEGNCQKKRPRAQCVCDCGNKSDILLPLLISKKTTSCGCEKGRLFMERHFQGDKHLRSIWRAVRRRCYNPKATFYCHYGGRGIVMCDAWLKWDNFRDWATKTGYKNGLEIERIDNEQIYHPDNCKWATRKEQTNNTRASHIAEAWGEAKTIAQWTEDARCRVSYKTLHTRLNRLFWEPERAISTPSLKPVTDFSCPVVFEAACLWTRTGTGCTIASRSMTNWTCWKSGSMNSGLLWMCSSSVKGRMILRDAINRCCSLTAWRDLSRS